MKTLYWCLTNACNLNCSYCYYNTGLEKRVFTSYKLEENMELVSRIAQNFQKVIFTGGEPFLYPKLFELIEKCSDQNIQISILTNGVALTKENIRKIVNSNIKNISISLDSLNNKVNDKQRGKAKRVKKNIKNLIKNKNEELNIEIMQSITSKNIFSISRMLEFCCENNLNLWINTVDILDSHPKYKTFSLLEVTKKKKKHLKKALQKWSNRNNNKFDKYIENIFKLINDTKITNQTCPMGQDVFVLDVDGTIYPCFLRKDLMLGNVYKNSFKQIFNSPKLKDNIDDLKNARCVTLGCLCLTDLLIK